MTPEREADSCVVAIDLTAGERELLAQGLFQWRGPAAPTDALAVAMGFTDVRDLLKESKRIGDALRRGAFLHPFAYAPTLDDHALAA
jgi:hypothetical protein